MTTKPTTGLTTTSPATKPTTTTKSTTKLTNTKLTNTKSITTKPTTTDLTTTRGRVGRSVPIFSKPGGDEVSARLGKNRRRPADYRRPSLPPPKERPCHSEVMTAVVGG
ncbi:hypothetical protein ACFFQW_10170 [Umezawaea endophytica]|uniref:Uncharacterized protein n=1 Tax=Umezawaea endophytica TaxID=1654476 RepID=A0A9X3AF72_9PSEU|nr:hypothetical protein [Umezawaea endophytica]MCS7478352.1 hypothetical protein [Umezawaea endophytica]